MGPLSDRHGVRSDTEQQNLNLHSVTGQQHPRRTHCATTPASPLFPHHIIFCFTSSLSHFAQVDRRYRLDHAVQGCRRCYYCLGCASSLYNDPTTMKSPPGAFLGMILTEWQKVIWRVCKKFCKNHILWKIMHGFQNFSHIKMSIFHFYLLHELFKSSSCLHFSSCPLSMKWKGLPMLEEFSVISIRVGTGVFPLLKKKSYLALFERQIYREMERQGVRKHFHLLVNSPNGLNGQSWATLKPRAWSPRWVSRMRAGSQGLGPFSDAFPDHKPGAGAGAGTHMGCWCYRQKISLIWNCTGSFPLLLSRRELSVLFCTHLRVIQKKMG